MAVSILAAGCGTPSRRLAPFMRYPVEPEFTVVGLPVREASPIDTNKVYVQKIRRSPDDEGYYIFIRFWPDGRCFMSSVAFPELDREKVDKIEAGEPGYFRIVGDEIFIETFSPEDRGSYVLRRGILLKSETGETVIRILEERYRGGFSLSLVPRVYRYPHFENPRFQQSDFYPVDFGPLSSEPTWPVDPRQNR